MEEKDIILLINEVMPANVTSFRALEKELGYPLRGVVLVDSRQKDSARRRKSDVFEEMYVNLDSHSSIKKALREIEHRILAVTCRNEPNLTLLRKIIPNIPYVKMPTETSLVWSTSKNDMRERFDLSDFEISPRHVKVEDADKKTIDSTAEAIGFPAIVKPSGLMSSLLVQEVTNIDELQKALDDIFEYINQVHAKVGRYETPEVVVEQRMIGNLYSIDSYINSKGDIWHCPAVNYVDGVTAGFDDFFCYNRTAPAAKPLTVEEELQAQRVVEEGVKLLGLKSTSTHTEVIHTDEGWRLIEIGPRVGGYRHEMYARAYGIDHTLNDMKVRMDMEPIISNDVVGYSAVFTHYPKKEGVLVDIKGIEVIEALQSCEKVTVAAYAKPGEVVKFSRNGGERLVSVLLGADSQEQLQADIEAMENALEIVVE